MLHQITHSKIVTDMALRSSSLECLRNTIIERAHQLHPHHKPQQYQQQQQQQQGHHDIQHNNTRHNSIQHLELNCHSAFAMRLIMQCRIF